MARYTRDEIIAQGLDLAASPTVLQHDMSGGVVNENAWAIKWLQNALDMFHRKFPFSSDIASVAVTIQGNNTDVVLTSDGVSYLPTDFMIDVRNGLVVTINNQTFRLTRKSFQYWLSVYNYSGNTSFSSLSQGGLYCIVNNRIKVAPLTTTSQAGTLWYYALPALLTATSTPPFPDEWSLIEFIRLKALEWTRSIDVGTAQMYLQKELARFKANGLLNEAEYDVIPLENNQVLPDGALLNRNAWMGNIAI